MGNFGLVSLYLLSLGTLFVCGQDTAESAAGDAQSGAASEAPKLDVTLTTTFPAAEIFGVKLVNGQPTEALLTFSNNEPDPVTVNFVGGSLWTEDAPNEPGSIIRNLTAVRYDTQVAASDEAKLPFSFTTDMHPQDLRLNLAAIVTSGMGTMFTVHAYNQTVSIVEPDTSIFDPQTIFLYVFLLTCFVGVMYFFYTVWIAPYFPQKRKGGKAGDRKPKSAAGQSGEGAASDAGVASAKTYDAEWIPAHHIQPPTARKVKGGKVKK